MTSYGAGQRHSGKKRYALSVQRMRRRREPGKLR